MMLLAASSTLSCILLVWQPLRRSITRVISRNSPPSCVTRVAGIRARLLRTSCGRSMGLRVGSTSWLRVVLLLRRRSSMPERPWRNSLAASLMASSMLHRPYHRIGEVTGGSPRPAPIWRVSRMSNEQIGLPPIDYMLSLSPSGRPGMRRNPGESVSPSGYGGRA